MFQLNVYIVCIHYIHFAFVFLHSFPITVNVNLLYVSDPSDRFTYSCTKKFPISGTIYGPSVGICNQCQFNRTGKFEFDATFENNASIDNWKFYVTISDGNGCTT